MSEEMATMDRSTTTDQTLSVEQVKQAYWKRVIDSTDPSLGRPFRRLVGWIPSKDYDPDWRKGTKIWRPENVDEDFNLVLSLCDDGLHRQVKDMDTTVLPIGTGHKYPPPIIVPSTSHWHVIENHAQRWPDVLGAAGNDKYKNQSMPKGYLAIRVPWVSKYGGVPSRFDRSHFYGFDDTDFEAGTPKSDGKVGWEDLFGEG